jgi:hypothetical protein
MDSSDTQFERLRHDHIGHLLIGCHQSVAQIVFGFGRKTSLPGVTVEVAADRLLLPGPSAAADEGPWTVFWCRYALSERTGNLPQIEKLKWCELFLSIGRPSPVGSAFYLHAASS